MSPSEEYSTEIDASNANRQNEIISKMKQAGMLDDFNEYLTIESMPCVSYNERLKMTYKR